MISFGKYYVVAGLVKSDARLYDFGEIDVDENLAVVAESLDQIGWLTAFSKRAWLEVQVRPVVLQFQALILDLFPCFPKCTMYCEWHVAGVVEGDR